MQSPSPQAFNHTLLPSLRHVRTLSFPFSFILYFLTSFLLSLHPPRPVYSRVPIWALETEPSRWSDRRQIFSVFRELTMRAERDEQKKKGKCKKDERDREQEGWGREKKSQSEWTPIGVHQSLAWSSFFLFAAGATEGNRSFPISPFNMFWLDRKKIHHGKLVIMGTVSVTLGF